MEGFWPALCQIFLFNARVMAEGKLGAVAASKLCFSQKCN